MEGIYMRDYRCSSVKRLFASPPEVLESWTVHATVPTIVMKEKLYLATWIPALFMRLQDTAESENRLRTVFLETSPASEEP